MAEMAEAKGWARAEGDRFLSLRSAYISNLTLLLGLGRKVLSSGWWVAILNFSLQQKT